MDMSYYRDASLEGFVSDYTKDRATTFEFPSALTENCLPERGMIKTVTYRSTD